MTDPSPIAASTNSASLLLGKKLDSIPFSAYHLQLILVLGAVGFVEGYDLALGGSLLVLAKEPLQPTFYQDLAQADALVDPAAAHSMISGYRSNNGLGPVVIDADLMRLASEQARAMAARGRPSDEGLVRKNFENNPTQGSLVT